MEQDRGEARPSNRSLHQEQKEEMSAKDLPDPGKFDITVVFEEDGVIEVTGGKKEIGLLVAKAEKLGKELAMARPGIEKGLWAVLGKEGDKVEETTVEDLMLVMDERVEVKGKELAKIGVVEDIVEDKVLARTELEEEKDDCKLLAIGVVGTLEPRVIPGPGNEGLAVEAVAAAALRRDW